MAAGFAVQPDKLTEFQTKVAEIADNYATIVSQLNEVQLRENQDLLGLPKELGAVGPPVDFTNASGAMLGNLATAFESLHRLHVAVGAQFTHMKTAFGETRDLYLQVDGERAGVFDDLLDDRTPDGR
ncbi:hypothetical protein [Actinophytocola sediminis]